MQQLIDRAQAAGEVRSEVVVDDVRTLMCGLGSTMAADAMGVMRYDWRRTLEFSLDGIRASGRPRLAIVRCPDAALALAPRSARVPARRRPARVRR